MESVEVAVVVGGVSDLFLRRPASCDGSLEGSGGGDPDIGGVGRDAHTGELKFEHKLRFKVNLEWSMLFLCRWKEGCTVGKLEKREDCIRLDQSAC